MIAVCQNEANPLLKPDEIKKLVGSWIKEEELRLRSGTASMVILMSARHLAQESNSGRTPDLVPFQKLVKDFPRAAQLAIGLADMRKSDPLSAPAVNLITEALKGCPNFK